MPTEYVVCAICGKKMRAIGSHFKVHGLTYDEYKEKFPSAELYSGQVLKKFSEAGYFGNIGKKRNYVHCVSEETKKKISLGNKGQKRSKEVRKKMSIVQKLRWEVFFKKHPKQPKTKKEKQKRTVSEEFRKKTSERMKKQWRDGKMKNVSSPMSRKRRSENISNYWKTHTRTHPLKGIPRSEETKKKMSESHRRGLASPNSKRRERHSIARKRMWENLTDEEKTQWMRKVRLSANKKPNGQEAFILQYILCYGFKYNDWLILEDKETKKRYIPDFVHDTHPLIIEFDGFLGHNIKSPYVSEDDVGKEEIRNRVYREHGYSVFCISENPSIDKYIMDLRLIEKIEEWILEQK